MIGRCLLLLLDGDDDVHELLDSIILFGFFNFKCGKNQFHKKHPSTTVARSSSQLGNILAGVQCESRKSLLNLLISCSVQFNSNQCNRWMGRSSLVGLFQNVHHCFQ